MLQAKLVDLYSGRIGHFLNIALTLLICLAFASVTFGQSTKPAAEKTLIDYFLPTPIVNSLKSDAWGAPNVLPRDPQNGLEDTTIKQWCYWDGQIIKGPDGKYHMFASRWDQARGHNGWPGSVAVHAVSDDPIGPYIDKGMCWPDSMDGKGHNVTALVLPNGEGYAVIVSETRPGTVFISRSLDGPWTIKGLLTVEGQPNWRASNVSVMVRPDGDYMIVPRDGQVMISKASDDICGPYKIIGPAYPKGIPNLEDPVVWYSGGLYHIVVNSWSTRKAYHLTSKDGKRNWVNRGLAYDPRKDFVRYTDGTVNHWNKMERPGVFLENGHVKYFTLASIDVEKNQERGNDIHGSKVVVIPFDGEAFDRDMAKIVTAEDAAVAAAAQPALPK
jgi:hypothetical protein